MVRHLMDRRDGLLRESDYLEKRLRKVHDDIIALNLQIPPYLPKDHTGDTQ